MNKLENKIFAIQLANYVRPEIKENSSKDWVLNGDNNSFYQYIIDCYNGSTTNSAIIDSYSLMTYGLGLNTEQNFISKNDLRRVCKDFVMFGEATIEVRYVNNKVQKLFHVAKQRVVPAKAIEGEINKYYYSFDWSDLRKFPPTPFDSYTKGKGTTRSEIYDIRDYQVGQFYFSNPPYVSCLPFAELEEELANYYINHIKNGLSFGHIININGGQPESEEQKNKISAQINKQLTGSSNAGKKLLSFNDSKETATTIEALEVSNAHEQYQFLSKEATDKISVGHKVVSGAILGIANSTGFSSNADQIETAFNETMLNVIQPKQELILDALETITGLTNLSFKPLRIDLQNDVNTGDTDVKSIDTPTTDPTATEDLIKKEASYNGAQIASSLDIMTGVKDGILTIDQAITFLIQMLQFDPAVAKALFSGNSADEISMAKDNQKKKSSLKNKLDYGEEIDLNEWELVSSEPVNYETEADLDYKMQTLNGENLEGKLFNLANVKTGVARTKSASEQDTKLYITRYRYGGNPSPEREFCKAMMNANKLYRKEDIELMSQENVNPGFGMHPTPDKPYDIFLWKGGGLLSDTFEFGTCKHFWLREMYRKIGTGKNTAAQPSTPADVRKNGEIAPTNDNRAYKAPHDM